MRRPLAVLICFTVSAAASLAQEPSFGPGMAASQLGGLMIFGQGNQSTVSFGGILFPRKVNVTTLTPEGPTVTRFLLPSALHSPGPMWLPPSTPAQIRVEIPDTIGLLYLDGAIIRTFGKVRQLESPPLAPGQVYPVTLRAAFAVGDKLLIEDRRLLLRAGESIAVTFDGTRATAVALPREPAVFPPVPKAVNP